MKHSLTLSLLLAPLVALGPAESNQPSIIVILTDDHGWADLGAQGMDTHKASTRIPTAAR